MEVLVGKSGRTYTVLPIDGTRGFPQTFPLLFGSQTYHFALYVNVAGDLLDDKPFIETPSAAAFLVVRVDREASDGSRKTIFVRKVVPNIEYSAGDIALLFSQQKVARKNLNGQGSFGSLVTGGIASRWA